MEFRIFSLLSLTMKFKLLIAFLFLCLFSYSQKKKVTAKITYREPYCGGARPTEEMVAESQKQKNYSGKMMMLVSEKGKIDSAKTNEQGELKFKLKKGTYKLFEPWRYYLNTPNGGDANDFNLDCLKQEWEKEAYLIVVTKKEIKIAPRTEIVAFCPSEVPCIKDSERPPGRQ
jgi:hypothetical protein